MSTGVKFVIGNVCFDWSMNYFAAYEKRVNAHQLAYAGCYE